MPTEIKTLFHQLSSPELIEMANQELAKHLNEGWEIVTLSHHSHVEMPRMDHHFVFVSSIVTLRRDSQPVLQLPILKDKLVFADKQRVMFNGADDENPNPLQFGDLGIVSIGHDGSEAVLFDRYDTLIYERRVEGRNEPIPILFFCTPYLHDFKRTGD